MKYTKGTRVTDQDNNEMKCVVADNETAIFGRVLYKKDGTEYVCYELLSAYSNFSDRPVTEDYLTIVK